MTPEEVLEFWFGSAENGQPVDDAHRKRWWKKDPAFDKTIADRFGETHTRADAGELDAWGETAAGRLALILVLDQFSRNLSRGSALAFAQDPKAQALALEGIERGHDEELDPARRTFLYMPLMHSENVEHQHECVRLFESLADGCAEEYRSSIQSNAKYARQHRDIVAQWGRFPHRNETLGRECTPEEVEFLKEPGSSF